MRMNLLSRSRGVALLATAAAFLLCSCADDDLGIVEGTVTVDGNDAEGVEVRLTGEGFDLFEITGLLGGYAFEVPEGTYTVALTEGLPPNIECSPGLSEEVEISLDFVTIANFACDTSGGSSE